MFGRSESRTLYWAGRLKSIKRLRSGLMVWTMSNNNFTLSFDLKVSIDQINTTIRGKKDINDAEVGKKYIIIYRSYKNKKDNELIDFYELAE